MRRILFFVFLLVSIAGFSQNPLNYQERKVYERIRGGFMVDSSFHLPRYNGVPSGLRVGMSPNDGALASDTLNGHVYHYWNTVWKRLAYYDEISPNNTNLGSFYRILVPSSQGLKGLAPGINILIDSTTNANSLTIHADTTTGFQKLATQGDIVKALEGFSAGSGTVNTGAANKAAYYPSGGTTVDDWVGVEFGNTNLNTKIISQATTEVPLEIKLASSQTANALNISSSSGTGDLVNIDATGRLTVDAGTNADGGITFGSGAAFYKTGAGAIGWSTSGGGGYGALGNGSFELYPVASGNTMSRGGGNVGAAVTAEFTMSPGNVSWLYQLGTSATTAVDQTFRAQNTTGSDKVGSNLIIQSGNGTGNTTTGSALQFQTPDATGSGSSAQSYTTKFQVNKLGQLKANLYGSGTFTGTATKFLAVDASGNLIEEDPPSGSGRFGVSGEDDDASADRSFTNDQYAFSYLFGGSGNPDYFKIIGGAGTLENANIAFHLENTGATRTMDLTVYNDGLDLTEVYDGSTNQFQMNNAGINLYSDAGGAEFSNVSMSGSGNMNVVGSVAAYLQGGNVSIDTKPSDASFKPRIFAVGDYKTLSESSATTFVRVIVNTSEVAGGEILITVESNDATDYQSRTLRFLWTAVNKAGTTTVTISTPEELVAASSGTLTVAITAVDSGSGNLDFKANAVSSLTQTTLRASYQVRKNFGTGTIAPQ